MGSGTRKHRSRAQRLRNLRLESLETRQLLAGDLAHNFLIAEDVNEDFMVSPVDVLLIINKMNGVNSEGEQADSIAMLDVNADGILSAVDALRVINRLNAEGESGLMPLMQYSYQFVDTSGNVITSATAGSAFQLQVFVQDLRPKLSNSVASVDTIDSTASEGSNLAGGNKITFESSSVFNVGDDIQIGAFQTEIVGFLFFDPDSNPLTQNSVKTNTALVRNLLPTSLTAGTAVNVTKPSPAAWGVFSASQDLGLTGEGTIVEHVRDPFLPFSQSINYSPVFASTPFGLMGANEPEEYFNELKAFKGQQPDFSTKDPTLRELFYSVDFTALAAGTVTFNPNRPDVAGNENSLFRSSAALPTDPANSQVDFGMPFTFTITADPTSPVAVNDTLPATGGAPLLEDNAIVIGANVLANDTVTSPRTLTVTNVSTIPGVTLGAVSGTTYTPPQDFFGTDRITYVATDSTGLVSGVATVTINISPVNDAPNAFNDSLSVDEASTNNVLNVLANNGFGADNAGPANETSDSITITRVGNAGGTTFTTANGGTVSIASGGAALIYTPAFTFIGTDTFTYTIADTGGLTATATVTVDVAPGVLPRARPDTGTGAEGTSVSVAVLANDSANPGANKVLKDGFTNGAHGTVARSGSDPNVLIYTPTNADFYGTDTFTYILNDDSGLGVDSVGTVAITITDVNDPVQLVNDAFSTNEDIALTIAISSLLNNDSPGAGEKAGDPANSSPPQTLTFLPAGLSALTAGGTVAVVGNNVVYTPTPNFNGEFRFKYAAQDNGSPVSSADATVVITVNPVNDKPIANDDSVSGTEDTTLVIPAGNTTIVAGNVLFNDSPGPNETGLLTVTGVGTPSGTSATTAHGSVTFDGTNLNYTPAANFNSAGGTTDTFVYFIRDPEGATASATVTVTVAAVNDKPVGTADSVTGFKDIPLAISAAQLLSNDNPGGGADEAGQTLSIAEVFNGDTSKGTVVLNSNGSVTYTPKPGITGPASFEYTALDSGGAVSDRILVNVTIREFVPSTLKGTISDNSLTSRRIGGITVMLTGVNAQGQALAAVETLSLADGSYSFTGLGPGTYAVDYAVPEFLRSGSPSHGHGNIVISNPAGTTVSGLDFAVSGSLDLSNVNQAAAYQLVIANFSSSHQTVVAPSQNATDTQNVVGAYFGIGGDNTAMWYALPPTMAGPLAGKVQAAELVLANGGQQAYLSVVDSNHVVTTRTLSAASRDFFVINDRDGNLLVGIHRVPTAFEVVDRATPPFNAHKYLDAVDAIFSQEGWN